MKTQQMPLYNNNSQRSIDHPAVYSLHQWEARAKSRIEQAHGNHIDRASVFKRNEAITAAYAEMYLRDPQIYKWAGMAALTSATVGRGMYIMRGLKQTRLGSMIGLFGREVAETFDNLGVGNLAVFGDIYWQHMAYEQGGIAELEGIFRSGGLDRRAFQAWRQIDEGRRTHDQALIWEGNTALLYFEQKEVLQPQVYDSNKALWSEVSGWIPSPIPGHRETFGDFSRDGNIGVFEERWEWIEQSMLPRWQALADTQPARVKQLIQSLMLGGDPLAIPGLPMLKLRIGVYQAIGFRNGIGAWRPRAPLYAHAG
jgi:hypothetical protein